MAHPEHALSESDRLAAARPRRDLRSRSTAYASTCASGPVTATARSAGLWSRVAHPRASARDAAAVRSTRHDEGQLDEARLSGRVIDALRGAPVIRRLGP